MLPELRLVGGPHVDRDFFDVCQQATLTALLQIPGNRGLFPVFEHIQDTMIVMIHDHGDVLLVFFFNLSSSMPIRRTTLRGFPVGLGRR